MSDLNKKPPAHHAPVYCAMYPELAEIARSLGYALAVHGSLARDFDLIAIPWIEKPAEPQVIIDAMCNKFAIRQIGEPEVKWHGRLVYTVSVAWGNCAFDIGFMPKRIYSRRVVESEGSNDTERD